MTRHAGTITVIEQAFRKLDLELPKAYVKALAEIAADRERLAALPTFDSNALADAVLDALAAGKDPAANAAVQRHLAAQQLHVTNARNTASGRLDDRTVTLLNQHADTIHVAMAELLAKFNETLVEARKVLPDSIDLADPASGSRVQPNNLPAWGNARATLDQIDRIAQTWKVLASVTRSINAAHDEPLIVAALSGTERDALGSRPKASAAALAGHSLSLATFDEFAERKARIARDRQAAAAAQPTFADTYRRTHGTGVSRRDGQVFTRP